MMQILEQLLEPHTMSSGLQVAQSTCHEVSHVARKAGGEAAEGEKTLDL